MKIIGLVMSALVMAVACNAQKVNEKDVPSAVVNAFKVKYPGATAKKWEKEEGAYETETMLKGKECEVAFNADGTWLETEREIKTKELPQAVKDGLAKSQYKDWEVEEAVEIESPAYKLAYELEMEKGKEKVSLYFTPDGKLVQEEKEEEKEKD